jgi:hypothetical protein
MIGKEKQGPLPTWGSLLGWLDKKLSLSFHGVKLGGDSKEGGIRGIQVLFKQAGERGPGSSLNSSSPLH